MKTFILLVYFDSKVITEMNWKEHQLLKDKFRAWVDKLLLDKTALGSCWFQNDSQYVVSKNSTEMLENYMFTNTLKLYCYVLVQAEDMVSAQFISRECPALDIQNCFIEARQIMAA
jgi:hypothetical protein